MRSAHYVDSAILNAVRRITGITSSASWSRYCVFVPKRFLQVGQPETMTRLRNPACHF